MSDHTQSNFFSNDFANFYDRVSALSFNWPADVFVATKHHTRLSCSIPPTSQLSSRLPLSQTFTSSVRFCTGSSREISLFPSSENGKSTTWLVTLLQSVGLLITLAHQETGLTSKETPSTLFSIAYSLWEAALSCQEYGLISQAPLRVMSLDS